MTERGRLAPTPSGWLHLGHARTFAIAWQRCRSAGGELVMRSDDLDRSRCRPEYLQAALDDLRWLGLDWQEGPDQGGPHAPYEQSQRMSIYQEWFQRLQALELVYPCSCSRKDVLSAARAPHAEDEEPIYGGTCRGGTDGPVRCWRWRVPDGLEVRFEDGHHGPQSFRAGSDFGDFVVWRNEPSYHLACAVDDHLMEITEVVRGADLLVSTARQLLIFDALGWCRPRYFHAPLMLDAAGQRLAKRQDALSLRTLREQGADPAALLKECEAAL